jgi:hypothetical protein
MESSPAISTPQLELTHMFAHGQDLRKWEQGDPIRCHDAIPIGQSVSLDVSESCSVQHVSVLTPAVGWDSVSLPQGSSPADSAKAGECGRDRLNRSLQEIQPACPC